MAVPAPRMVDVSGKPSTRRMARAQGEVAARPQTIKRIAECSLPKGDVLAAARLAGIAAAKRTHELIPLCHPLPLDYVDVDIQLESSRVLIEAEVKARGPTGVEMEALTSVAVAALTVYDMCKGVEAGIVIRDIRLLEKRGGRSGTFRAASRKGHPK